MLSLKKPQEFIGNSCIYYTYRFFTILQLVIGLGNIVTGVIVCVNSKSFAWYNVCYILTGIFILFLAMFGYTTYNSISRLICYLIWIFLCFLSELGFTLGILLVSQYDAYVGADYAMVAEYSMFGASGLLLCCFGFGTWYLSSVRDYYNMQDSLKLLSKT